MLFLQIGVVHADPFNKNTDSGMRCSVPVNRITRLYPDVKNGVLLPGLNDGMFVYSVWFKYNYDGEDETFETSFGPVKQSNRINLPVYDPHTGELLSLLSRTDPAIIRELGITDEKAREVSGLSKDQMGFSFRYDPAPIDRWTIFGLFDSGRGGLPRGLFLQLTHNIICTAILKPVPAPAFSTSQDISSAGGKHTSSK